MAIQEFDRDKTGKLADLAGKLADKAVKEDFTFEFQRTVHLIRQHDLVGALIAKAMENGYAPHWIELHKEIDLLKLSPLTGFGGMHGHRQ